MSPEVPTRCSSAAPCANSEFSGQSYYYAAPQDDMTFNDWKKLHVQPDTSVANKTLADQPCSPAAVAIMISGQLQRFVYKDQTGPLLAPAKCPLVADVYIALSNASSVMAPYQLWIHDRFQFDHFSIIVASPISEPLL